MIKFGRCVLLHIVLVENAFDLVDDSCALPHQMLPEVGELSNLGVLRIGRKNASNAIGTLSTAKPIPVIPEQLAEGVGVTFVGFMHGGVIGLNDDDFGTAGFSEFVEEPVVEAANFDDGHVATVFSCFFDESGEKFVNIVTIGTDLAFLHDIALFISDIDGQLALVLVDSKVQHGGLRGVKLLGRKSTLPHENPHAFLCADGGGLLSEYHVHHHHRCR